MVFLPKLVKSLIFKNKSYHYCVSPVLVSSVCEKMFRCSECVREYAQKKSLYRHIRKDHNPDYEPVKESYICAECEKSFLNKFKLVCHIREHDGALRIRRQKIRCSMRYQRYEDHLNSAHGISVNRKDLRFQNNQGLLLRQMTRVHLFCYPALIISWLSLQRS